MRKKLTTGGVHSGTGGQDWGGSAIDKPAACEGTGSRLQEDGGGPGGNGSSGTKSTSKGK